MDVLITGGAGFLGAHLADALLALGHRVTVLDNLSTPNAGAAARKLNGKHDASGRLSFIFRDVRDPAEVERAIVGRDAVFHAAGIESEESALLDPREDFSTRVTGTFNVLEAIRARAPLTHLIVPSTAAVYGTPPIIQGCATIAASEKQPVRPETPYASGAACAEKYALAYARAYGMRVTVFRIAQVYGGEAGFLPEHGWITRLVQRAREGQAMSPPADPRWPLDLLHVEDFCDATIAAWADPSASVGQVFNVGGGAKAAPSLREVVSFLGLLGGQISLLPPLGNGRPAFVLDNHRLRAVTGWEPAVDWQRGLSRLFAASAVHLAGDGWSTSDGTTDGRSEDGAGAVVAWPRAEGRA